MKTTAFYYDKGFNMTQECIDSKKVWYFPNMQTNKYFLANKTASSVRQRWEQKTAAAVLCNETTSPVIVGCSRSVPAETC